MTKATTAVALVLLLILSTLPMHTMGIGRQETASPAIAANVEISLTQNVSVSADGSANMSLIINIPSSPLADIYRKAFFTVPPSVPKGVELPIPENKTVQDEIELEEGVKDMSLIGDVNADGKVDILDIATICKTFGSHLGDNRWNPEVDVNWDGKISIYDLAAAAKKYGKVRPPLPESTEPVREVFHSGIVMDQAVLLGFETTVVDSKILPWGTNNETKISLKAYSSQLAKPIPPIWRINVGPWDENATEMLAEFMFTKIQFIQLMLHSLPSNQTYLFDWLIETQLPTGAQLLNEEELIGLNWTVDFGGGTSMIASVSLPPGGRKIALSEKMVVTQQNITATEEYLGEAFSEYTKFKIDYSLTGSSNQIVKGQATSTSENDWEKQWSWTISPGTYSKTWNLDTKITATVKVTPKLVTTWYVGWHFHWWSLQWFTTRMSIVPSIKTEAYAKATGSYSQTWSYTFVTWSHRFNFWVGLLPVWANLKLTVEASITVSAGGQVQALATLEAKAYFKAGVQWTRSSGWSGIWQSGTGASLTGPTISGTASLSVTPQAKCRVVFLFYDVAGPFVEGIPYAPATIHYNPNTWSIKLMFKVKAGCTFAGWLKTLLGLNDWSKTLADWTLAQWNGSW